MLCEKVARGWEFAAGNHDGRAWASGGNDAGALAAAGAAVPLCAARHQQQIFQQVCLSSAIPSVTAAMLFTCVSILFTEHYLACSKGCSVGCH